MINLGDTYNIQQYKIQGNSSLFKLFSYLSHIKEQQNYIYIAD